MGAKLSPPTRSGSEFAQQQENDPLARLPASRVVGAMRRSAAAVQECYRDPQCKKVSHFGHRVVAKAWNCPRNSTQIFDFAGERNGKRTHELLIKSFYAAAWR